MQLALAGAVYVAALLAHPDIQEDRLLHHFAVGVHELENGRWEDATHRAVVTAIGKPKLIVRGPTEALAFSGGEYLRLADTQAEVADLLPTREFAIAGWISVDAPEGRGGIAGCLRGERGKLRGWQLGYDNGRFLFGLATTGGQSTRTGMTWLRSEAPIRARGWHYVVASYDGTAMRLFVDGKLAGESAEQSGDIVYAPEAVPVIGAQHDGDSLRPLEGALFELKTYSRPMTPEEIGKVAEKNSNLLAWAAPAGEELTFLVKPYLQFGTLDSMTVMCETSRPTRMRVQYSENIPLTENAETAEPAHISEITLKGLKPHTPYFYRVVCFDDQGAEVRSEQYSFQTAPPADRAWAFAVIGDTQRNPVVTKKCAEGAFALRPNFLLHCGDVVDDGFAKNQWIKDLFEPSAKLMAHVPTFPVIGNHEKDSHWYYDYFSMPKPEYWYTFQYGNAQFFMIDTNRPLAEGTPQYKWLDEQLAASKATWKFACHHHPCFSSDEDDFGNKVKGSPDGKYGFGDENAQHAIPLYEKHGIDIVFNGHIHVYERTWPIFQMAINQDRGIRYITSGGGGGGLEHPAPQRTWFSLHVNRAHHFCHAAIHDRTIVFKAYDIEGRLFDTFELVKTDR